MIFTYKPVEYSQNKEIWDWITQGDWKGALVEPFKYEGTICRYIERSNYWEPFSWRDRCVYIFDLPMNRYNEVLQCRVRKYDTLPPLRIRKLCLRSEAGY